MKPRNTLAAALLCALSAAALAQNDPLIQETLQKHYPEDAEATPEYRQHLRRDDDKNADQAVCRLRAAGEQDTMREDEQRLNEGSRFCMRLHSEKTVEDAQGKRRYLLFIGDNLEQAHGAGGLAAFFIFKNDGGNWTLADKKEYETGEWGKVPDEWQWLEFAPGRFGVQGEHGFTQMGYVSSGYTLIHDDNDTIYRQHIFTLNENGASRDCDSEPKKARKACREGLFDLIGTLKIRSDMGADHGAYPLEVQVSGYKSTKKKYNKQPFIFHYDGKTHQYIVPKNYPLEML